MHCTLLLLGLAAASATLAADDAMTWTVGDVAYRYAPASRELTATCGGTTFRPLVDFGPAFVLGGAERAPADLNISLLTAEPHAGGLHGRYRAAFGAESADFALDIAPNEGGLRLRLSSDSVLCPRVHAGRTVGLGTWRRFNYMRNAEPYGQPFWPRVAYAPQSGLYVAARWDMAAAAGTSWDAPDQRFQGEGDFAAGLDVVYDKRTDGTRLPLDESLDLRVGRDLWATLPPPGPKPSEYREALAQCVFLDVWGGPARDTEYFLRHLSKLTAGRARFFTVLEDWEAGGFDTLLPDSILMPDYPPNPGCGTVDELRSLAGYATSIGRYAMRTNYVYLRDGSPSARAGRAVRALGADGKPKWHTRPADWLPLVRRQEAEIHDLFSPNAGFTDQMSSGGAPWGYTDFDARQPRAGSMGETLARQRELCRLIKDTHHGPLGSETNIDEQLLGEFVDTGDFGIFDGYHRTFTPEFKLRRLQGLSVFHGMGLMYRFFEMPPFDRFHAGTTRYLTDAAQYDDYRAAEVLYGNGGYLFYYPGMPWDYVLTECLLVGTLQRHYALQAVRDVHYWAGGRWQTLQELVAAGLDPWPVPWAPQPEAFRRIRVTYADGLQVLVNRSADECTVSAAGQDLTLPRSGWAAWMPDGKLLAYSAYAPGTRQRVDFIRDDGAGLQYLNPRGAEVIGQKQPTLWLDGKLTMRLDPATGDAWVDGVDVPYAPPRLPAHTRLDFRFDHDVQGWAGAHDVGPLHVVNGALRIDIVGEDPYLSAPPLDLAADSVKTVVVRMRTTGGTFGKIYFQADGVKATAEEMCLHFPVKPGAEFVDIRIPVGEHRLWKGHRIVGMRLDPEHGATPGVVEIESIRGE
jgi:hypothetical protein